MKLSDMCVSAISLGYGFTYFENILGWCVLLIQFVWLIFKLVVVIKDYLNNITTIDEADGKIENIVDAIENIADEVNGDKYNKE